MSLQIHESVGHAIELDRILGWEAAFAGTSWLDLAQLGSLRFGSELMNITIDPTIPGALGSFGFDDEGTPAAARDAVRNGIWVGVLAGRDSAAMAGLDYAGSVRADGFARLPMVRMTNVGSGARPAHARGDDRGDRRRRPDGAQPVLVHRRPAAELPVRLRDRLGDQATAGEAGC